MKILVPTQISGEQLKQKRSGHGEIQTADNEGGDFG